MTRMTDEYDVVVAGGGPAGIGAAVAAARNGARTLLVEGANRLGGTGTNGLVNFLRAAGEEGGVVKEWQGRLIEMGAAQVFPPADDLGWYRGSVRVNPYVSAIVAMELVLEAGAHVLFHTLAEGVEMEGDRLCGVYVANKGGRQLVRTKLAVDATGDGDLAAWAGAPFEKGREDGTCQAVSLNFHLSGVDEERLPSREKFVELTRRAIESGRIEMPSFVKSLALGGRPTGYPPGTIRFQYDIADDVDGSDAESLSRGEILCHRRVLMIWRFLREEVPGFENTVISDMASYLGVRETRRIRGEAKLTDEDVLEARKYPDAISRGGWYMDMHDGETKTNEGKTALAPPGKDFYEIRYGCLVPMEVDGLLLSGRCISATRPANGAMRIQGTCVNLGQAAGTAAAICAKQGLRPRELRGEDLRATLKKQGMDL